jgi:DNA-binding MarR family transcriptional regulator
MNNLPEKDKASLSETINRLIHEPSRYEILSVLFVVENTDFTFLMRHTGFTGGNLSTHLKKLKDANYIEIKKEFLNNKPHTSISLTGEGRTAFEQYRARMKLALDTLPSIDLSDQAS